MNLKKCQIFTPRDIASYMLDQIDYIDDIFNKYIIDNACGDGALLVEVVERFIANGVMLGNSKIKVKNALKKYVIGCDIDNGLVAECKKNLDDVAYKYGISNVDWRIYNCDGLYLDENIKYDFIIGNPPYIAYPNLDSKNRNQTKENFKSCSLGKFDYSYAFIEKGLEILKPGGKMVMITPSNMFKTVYGKNLRELIKDDIISIIDCSKLKVFGNVLTSPAITLYEKNAGTSVLIYREFIDKKSSIEKIISKNELKDKWNFSEYKECGNKRFGDYYKVSNCIATLANGVFVHNADSNGKIDIDIENSILRDAKSPKSEHYGIRQKIIFPYYFKKDELKRYTDEDIQKKFPKTMKYLETQKNILLKRDSDISAKWYEYGRSQAIRHMNCEKLLLSTIITKKVLLYKLDEKTIPYSGIYIIPKGDESLESAELILKSKDFFNYLLTKGIKVSGDSIRISSKDIEEYRY